MSAFRLFKVIVFGIHRKHVRNFLLVRHSNLGAILHHFRDIAGFCTHDPTSPPLFHPNFRGVPTVPTAADHPCWGQLEH